VDGLFSAPKRMKTAFVGSSALAWQLLQEASRASDQPLPPSVLQGPLRERALAAGIPLRLAASAEDVMLDPANQVVVLALEDCDEILRLTRAAVQAEKHVVVVLPELTASPALTFELQLVLDESQTAIIPLLGRWQLPQLPPDRVVLGLDPDSIRQLTLELPLPELSDAALAVGLRTGLDLLTASGFLYSQVTCLDQAVPGAGLISRMVSLSTQPEAERLLPPASLTLRPANAADGSAGVLLTVTYRDGRQQQYPVGEAPMLPRILHLCRHRADCSAWLDAASATLELCEATARSIRRRRTVDVHFDAGTERSVFKSQMTAFGCGVLTWLLLGMVSYLIAGQLLTLPNWAWHTARILWMLPLILFLMAQLLLPLTRNRGGNARGNTGSSADNDG